MARLILDTGILIAGTRGLLDVASLADTDDVAIPALAVAEYSAGSALDSHPGRAAAQRAFLDELLAILPVLEYDQTVAEHHATLLAHVRRTGTRRGAHDLMIAATARATDRIVLTTDTTARFGELPQVKARIARFA